MGSIAVGLRTRFVLVDFVAVLLGTFVVPVLRAEEPDRDSSRYVIRAGLKRLAVLDNGKVVMTAGRDGADFWRIGRTDAGLTIRPFGGKWRLRYLTGDTEGNVILSEAAGGGSFWSFDFKPDEYSTSSIRIRSRANGRRNLTCEGDRPRLTDQQGASFTIGVVSP